MNFKHSGATGEIMADYKYIKSSKIMWELFCEYKLQTKSTPIEKHVFVGKDGNSTFEQRERPLTLDGFENFCADKNVIQDMGDYFSNKDNRYKDFVNVCKRIKRVIRQDQIEGGMAMIYHPSITQRLNGLVDKKEETGAQTITVKYERKINNTGSTSSESRESVE